VHEIASCVMIALSKLIDQPVDSSLALCQKSFPFFSAFFGGAIVQSWL